MKMQQFKIHVTRRSMNIRKEFNNYTWQRDKEGKWRNVPIDMWNHALDGIRYVVLDKVLGAYGSGMSASEILDII